MKFSSGKRASKQRGTAFQHKLCSAFTAFHIEFLFFGMNLFRDRPNSDQAMSFAFHSYGTPSRVFVSSADSKRLLPFEGKDDWTLLLLLRYVQALLEFSRACIQE